MTSAECCDKDGDAYDMHAPCDQICWFVKAQSFPEAGVSAHCEFTFGRAA
jgi:hypothetical protein